MAQSSQYSDPVEFVAFSYNDPVINGRTQRKRLVFIRRTFERQTTLKGITFAASLDAGGISPIDKHYNWLPWMTSYDSDNKLKLLNEKCLKVVNKKVEFKSFSVILSSIMFISFGDCSVTGLVYDYFRDINCRQAGEHVLLKSSGKLYQLSSVIEPHPERINQSRHYLFRIGPITSIYPVIRHEWQTTGDDRVVYGLHYGEPSGGQTVDNISGRYYHRISDYCLKAYGVNELTKEDILKFKETIGDKPFTALYVCAGAKLTVFDPYTSDNISGLDEVHNRGLVQHGGVVIYEGELRIRYNINDRLENGDLLETRSENWQEFCTKHMKPMKQEHHGPEYLSLNQKVIFLCGTDSSRNTIAWGFSLKIVNGSAHGYLTIPFERNRNTRIEAIAAGIPGLDEIIARMGYEQLHDSVLTEHGTAFEPVQNCQMLRNVLNVTGERYLEVDIRKHLTKFESRGFYPKDIPQEFNLSHPSSLFLKDDDNEFFKLQSLRKTRAAPSPMYPIIKTDNDEFHYWPSLEIPIANVDSECYKYDRFKRLSVEIIHGQPYRARKYDYYRIFDFKAFHYERMTQESDQKYQTHSGQYHISDQSYYRIGVDGWMWRKVTTEVTDDGPKPIYQEYNLVLLARPTPVVAPRPQRPQGATYQNKPHYYNRGSYGNRRGR